MIYLQGKPREGNKGEEYWKNRFESFDPNKENWKEVLIEYAEDLGDNPKEVVEYFSTQDMPVREIDKYATSKTGKNWEQGAHIDPEIKELVYELNDSGYKTVGSCSGHGGENGFVTFTPDLSEADEEDIQYIFRKHGIPIIKIKRYPYYYSFDFRGIG